MKKLYLLSCIACLLQGCIGAAIIADVGYAGAHSEMEHAAYTEYLFAQTASNERVISEEEWLANSYRPKFSYAEYYSITIKHNGKPIPFEDWKGKEYKKFIADKINRAASPNARKR